MPKKKNLSSDEINEKVVSVNKNPKVNDNEIEELEEALSVIEKEEENEEFSDDQDFDAKELERILVNNPDFNASMSNEEREQEAMLCIFELQNAKAMDDQDSFRYFSKKLIDLYYPNVIFKFAARLYRKYEIEEISEPVQEVMVVFIDRLLLYDFEKGTKVSSYIYNIVQEICRKMRIKKFQSLGISEYYVRMVDLMKRFSAEYYQENNMEISDEILCEKLKIKKRKTLDTLRLIQTQMKVGYFDSEDREEGSSKNTLSNLKSNEDQEESAASYEYNEEDYDSEDIADSAFRSIADIGSIRLKKVMILHYVKEKKVDFISEVMHLPVRQVEFYVNIKGPRELRKIMKARGEFNR